MPDGVTKTIVGQCEEISEKNGWTTFHINVGTKYPERLATKLPALIEQARAVGQDVATWTFKEVESDRINENTGKPYINKYFDKVEVGASAPAATASGTALPEAHHEQMAPSDKDRAISRLAILKAAAELYSGKGDPDAFAARIYADKDDPNDEGILVGDRAVLAVLEAADRMERHVYRDIDDLPF